MMLSVCVPVYNYDARGLVRSLAAQASLTPGSSPTGEGREVEVVCLDDGSGPEWRERGEELKKWGRYVRLEENVGRSRVRNLFLDYTEGDWLLFLDVDSEVGEGFLARYVEALHEGVDVVVGGRVYDRRGNDDAHRLRYLYGTEVESKGVEWRRRHPYQSFMSNNFAVRREVLRRYPFDESITHYGHEDTLFGYRLEQAGVRIVHIDNPVVNGEVEENEEFLAKTVEAVRTLAEVEERFAGDERFGERVRLVGAYRRLRRLGLTRPVGWLCELMRRPMESHFRSGNAVSVAQLNFYKLGEFIKAKNKINKNV
ncbi:MAG: glycosyltransferase family 2 protein [Bacteroidales bacterium]|nr:glycosyltransferase family 2 protein [Bacteroidales bacterium]